MGLKQYPLCYNGAIDQLLVWAKFFIFILNVGALLFHAGTFFFIFTDFACMVRK